MDIVITFTAPVLGTKAADPETFNEYIAGKCPDAALQKQEAAHSAKRDAEESSEELKEAPRPTVFHRNAAGQPIIYDYQLKGYLKSAGEVKRVCAAKRANAPAGKRPQTPWSGITGKVDDFVMVGPREIPLVMPAGAAITICERPIKVMTPKGPRVAVVRSEEVPAGTALECSVEVYPDGPVTEAMVREMLDRGTWTGMGQWRNSGKGRFTWAERK